MLGPFRIRNLRRSTSPPNRASYAAASRRGSLDTLVSVRGTEYEYNILMHPESKLKYLDEDDGEMVTVGTSLELSQRLDEPVPRIFKPRLNESTALGRATSVCNASTSLSQPTHVFEIDRRDDAIKIWQEIEERSRQFLAPVTPEQPQPSTVVATSLSSTPLSDNMIQQAQFADRTFQSLECDYQRLSEASCPQTNGPPQKVDDVEAQNQLGTINDEYPTEHSDRLGVNELRLGSDEIETAEEGLLDFANRSRRLNQESFEFSNHKQQFEEAIMLKQEAQETEKEKEEGLFKELEAISSPDDWNVSLVTISGRLSLDGALANICLDTNCDLSLVDSSFLQKCLPDCRLIEIDPVSVQGIGETFLSSNKYALFDLYIPCNGGQTARLNSGARLVNNLPVPLLVGTDIIEPEGITINVAERLATIESCESLQVPLSVVESTEERQEAFLQKKKPRHGQTETPRNWRNVIGACRYCRRRKIRCRVAPTSSDGRCVNCVRFEQECKIRSFHGQVWSSPTTNDNAARYWPYQWYYSSDSQYDPRLLYFTATNPPQVAHEKSEEPDKPAQHTRMRVSDVLNNENEAKAFREETAPLLDSFNEGSLTAEGRRQAMEAGIRLRMRSNPAFRMNWTGGHGSQQMNANRWAQYGSKESVNTAKTVPSSTTPTPELAQPASPLLVSPMAHTQSVSDTEGSLLHAFRAELAKITNAKHDESVENSFTRKSDTSPEKTVVQEQPQIRPNASGPELEAFTRNLLLQTIASIGSNVETLSAQLQNHVLDVIPTHMIRPRATPIKYHLRNACSDFKSSIDAALEALAVEPSVDDKKSSPVTLQIQPPLPTAIRSLQAMTHAFDTFSQRLRMIEDSKASSDSDEANSSSLHQVVREGHGEHKASQTVNMSLKAVTGFNEENNAKTTVPRNASPSETIEAPIQVGKVGPSASLRNNQAAGYEDSKDVYVGQNTTRHRTESPITYRYIPSQIPSASMGTARGRPQCLVQNLALPSGLVNRLSPPSLQYKRRSMPEIEHRRESRPRSRSPGASIAREMPVPQRSEILHPKVQRSGLHSNLPIRRHHLGSAPGRPNVERNGAIVRTPVSPVYQPLPQQRPSNKAAHVRFGATSVYPPHVHSEGDKKRLVEATTLRHSKSLSAIRKPPPPLDLSTPRDADARSGLFGTLNKSFNDRKRAQLDTLAGLTTTKAPVSCAVPSSPLVATRFPTLEQFEDSNRRSVLQFPPLPSMEPLIPVRVNADKRGVEADLRKSQEVGSRADQKPATYKKEWVQQRESMNESSGDFFRRMTGLDEPSEQPGANTHGNPAPLDARLIKPFDPVAETATIHRHQLIEGVRRSATVIGLPDRYAGANRRPYSAYFDGNGRVEWDSFLGNRIARAQDKHDQLLAQSIDDGHEKESVQRNVGAPPQTEAFPSPVGARTDRPPEYTIARDGTSTPLHFDASTVSSVQFCVGQLKDLGFGREEDGGAARLVVYAQAANGNLEVAMDMIEEERSAYKERN
ncbi:hypothetical protein MMC26_005519 [Xylographa opegraphella]|nr:hypothetical protein [Xylographa opegraphella]